MLKYVLEQDGFRKGLCGPGCDGASTPVHPEPVQSSDVIAKNLFFFFWDDTFAIKRVQKTGHLGEAVSAPAEWDFAQQGNSILLRVPAAQSARFRRVYGMVVSVNHESSFGTISPLMFTCVLKLPFYFSGCALSAETVDEWDLDHTVLKAYPVLGAPPPINLFGFR